jgi:hypothetical protein
MTSCPTWYSPVPCLPSLSMEWSIWYIALCCTHYISTLHRLLHVPVSPSHWMTSPANCQPVVTVESGVWSWRPHVSISANTGVYSHIPTLSWTTALCHLQRLLDSRQMPDMGTTHATSLDWVSVITQYFMSFNWSLLGGWLNGDAWAISVYHLFMARLWIVYWLLFIQENLRILCINDTIQNSAIYLCTWAFRMSRVESLCAESKKLALAAHWQILLCSYARNLSALKKQPCYRAVHQSSQQGRIALNSVAWCPAGIRFKELLDALHIAIPPIIPFRTPTIPHRVIIRSTPTLASATFLRHVHLQTPSVGSVQRYSHTILIMQLFLTMGLWWTDWCVVCLF